MRLCSGRGWKENLQCWFRVARSALPARVVRRLVARHLRRAPPTCSMPPVCDLDGLCLVGTCWWSGMRLWEEARGRGPWRAASQ
eukprot:3300441-Prymnesium_polylepis.1